MKITYTVCVSHIFYLSIIPILCEVFGRLLLILYTWVFSSFSSFSMILLFQIRVICNFGCFLRHTRMISCVLPAWEGEAPVTYTPNYCKTSSGMKFLFPEWVLDFLTFVTLNQVSLNLLSLIKTWKSSICTKISM